MQVGLDEWGGGCGCAGRRVDEEGTNVAQDSGVDSVVEAGSTSVRYGANPVVVDGLVGIEHEGVALASVCRRS